MVICLERGVSCFSKIQIGFTFLVPAHPGSPGQRAVKRVCVCGDRRTRVCEQLAQGCCMNLVRPGVEPATFYVASKHPNRYTTRPHGCQSKKTWGPVQNKCWAAVSPKYKKGSPYSIAERRVPELIPVLGSQPVGDVSHKPGGRLPLLSVKPAVTPATLKRAATSFAA